MAKGWEFHSRPSDGDVKSREQDGDCKTPVSLKLWALLIKRRRVSPVSIHDHIARVPRMSLNRLPEPLEPNPKVSLTSLVVALDLWERLEVLGQGFLPVVHLHQHSAVLRSNELWDVDVLVRTGADSFLDVTEGCDV